MPIPDRRVLSSCELFTAYSVLRHPVRCILGSVFLSTGAKACRGDHNFFGLIFTFSCTSGKTGKLRFSALVLCIRSSQPHLPTYPANHTSQQKHLQGVFTLVRWQ